MHGWDNYKDLGLDLQRNIAIPEIFFLPALPLSNIGEAPANHYRNVGEDKKFSAISIVHVN